MNKLFQFWQELKRRKVVRVITVYAASAFVILELVDIITEPFGLPDWTLKLVVVLLSIGLLMSMILSWIYDVKPEGGFERTKPAQMVKSKDQQLSSGGWKIATYLSFAVISALIVYNILSTGNKSGASPIPEKSIAVLPFSNLSQEEGNDHFTDGLVADLLNRISVLEDLKVISHTSSEMFRKRGVKSIPEISHELGDVSYIVVGSVQRNGDNARIIVQLVDAINDDNIWSENYDRAIDDIFETQSEIAMQIASELNTILTSKQKSHIQDNKTENVQAFELYQMGLFNWNKRTVDGFNASIVYFEDAINEDPGYGLAYAGLADTYYLMALQGCIDKQEGRDKAVELALMALELDENLAEAHAVLGSVYDYLDWDWDKAERTLKQAIKINPNYATAYQYYSEHLSITNRQEEARVHINKALELSPLSFIIRHVSTKCYYNQGDFDKALMEVQKCQELQPDHPWNLDYEFYIYQQLEEDEKAYQTFRKICTIMDKYDLDKADSIYNESGFSAVFDWKIEIDINDAGNINRSYYMLADSYGIIGEDEKALDWLEKAYESHETTQINWNLHFKTLRNHSRFIAILKKMGLEHKNIQNEVL